MYIRITKKNLDVTLKSLIDLKTNPWNNDLIKERFSYVFLVDTN